MKSYKATALLFLFLLFISCDRKSCETDNSIFLEYSFSDQEYKTELAKQIQSIGQENLRYWLHDYINDNNIEHLLFWVQNEALCAEILVTMEHWNDLEFVQNKKAVGSRNAEFKDLRFDIQRSDSGEIRFVYKSVERIID